MVAFPVGIYYVLSQCTFLGIGAAEFCAFAHGLGIMVIGGISIIKIFDHTISDFK